MGADETSQLICRHCERPIAVPASNCPWCSQRIMVICAACKQYTADNESVCQSCHQPLQVDRMEKVRQAVGLRPELVQLVEDQERAKLVASAIVARHLESLFFSDGQRRTILAELFGSPPTQRTAAAALLFSALAYLVTTEYCSLVPREQEDREPMLEWEELKPWDGQTKCIEGMLASLAGAGLPVQNVVKDAVKTMMGFRVEHVRAPLIRTPGMPETPPAVNLSTWPALVAVFETARRAELPEYDVNATCGTTHRLLVDFTQSSSPEQTQRLVEMLLDLVDWFIQFEQDPILGLVD